jgi:hypothetical protein
MTEANLAREERFLITITGLQISTIGAPDAHGMPKKAIITL